MLQPSYCALQRATGAARGRTYLQGKVQEACIFHGRHSDFSEGRKVTHDCKLSKQAILLIQL